MIDHSSPSIRDKLRFMLSMSILFMLLIAGVILMINSFFSNRTLLANEINALAEVTRLAILPSFIFDNKGDAQQTLETLQAHNNIVYASVIKKNQTQLFAFYQRPGNWDLPEKKVAIINDCQAFEFTLTFLNVCKPLVYDDVNYGKILLVVSLQDIYLHLLKGLVIAFLGLIIASRILFLILGQLANKLIDPILELLTISEQVSQSGKYDKRATIQSSDEIGRLGKAFNIMLDKIQIWNDTLISQKETLEALVLEGTQEKNKALVLADEAQKASVAKSDFLSVMSHEIRTPLNAIIGFSDLLKSTSLNQEQTEYLDIINQSGNSLLLQINDILDFSKIEAGKMELNPVWFDIYELLNTVLASNRYESNRKSLNLTHQIDSELPRYLYGDEQKIRQILYNLLNNAIKFTEYGFISLTVNFNKISALSCELLLSVKDTGIGISEDNQAQLFDPFTQGDAPNVRKYGGTGLGLAIVKKMVILLKGEITLHSFIGMGTEFLLKIPLSLTLPESDKKYSKATLIALFEDNIHSALATRLKRLGYALESIDITQRELLQKRPDLIRKYHLLLFSQDCLDHALFWQNRLLQHEKKRLSGHIMSLAYCVENGSEDKVLEDMCALKVNVDNLEMIEQITSLIKSEYNFSLSKKVNDDVKVLVVEDNRVNLLMTQQMLKQANFTPLPAANGQLAVDLFKTNKIALILMDCQMPVMDGLTATREIRLLELESNRRIPIIALTANAFKEDREACFDAGMDDFLSKPFKIKQLLDVVNLWLNVNIEYNSTIQIRSEELIGDVLDKDMFLELLEMNEDNSKEFITLLSDTFFTDSDQLIQQIEQAFSEKEIEVIKRCAHQLKSSSMNLAAKRLSAYFTQLEGISSLDEIQKMLDLWVFISEEYSQVKHVYRNFFKYEIDSNEKK